MTPWLSLFTERLRAIRPQTQAFSFREGPPPALVIQAAHPEVGDLVIYDDGDELTVEVGQIYHTHFDSARTRPREGYDLRTSIAVEAAKFAADVLADRAVFEVIDCEDGIVGASFEVPGEDVADVASRDPNAIPNPSGGRSTLFRWSGPLRAAERRHGSDE